MAFSSSFLFSFPFEFSLVLSRNSQLHAACYKRGVFLHSRYAVDEWFEKMSWPNLELLDFKLFIFSFYYLAFLLTVFAVNFLYHCIRSR